MLPLDWQTAAAQVFLGGPNIDISTPEKFREAQLSRVVDVVKYVDKLEAKIKVYEALLSN